jgi:pimeloyl-ACP methyl ester carboxylesterase
MQDPRQPTRWLRRATGAAALAAAALATGGAHAAGPAALKACRIDGVPNELKCGQIERALDPARPDGPKIQVHYLVVPAMARNKQPDAVLMLAGGPGQSAIDVAARVLPRLNRLNNRRDLVFIDQRGTGRSAPLQCADDSKLPLAQTLDPAARLKRLEQCREDLAKLPYGDLRFFTTTIAMQDMDAVREALGVPQWNLIGGSYGTRAALEYLRQFPAQVRRTVIDGVAPPDMVLPVSFSTDNEAGFERVLAGCEKEPACQARYPQLRADWATLMASLPRQVTVAHPLSGEPQTFSFTRELAVNSLRPPMYAPALASGLPAAIHAAALGRVDALVGLAWSIGGGKGGRLAEGMHFSVVCAEDVPRIGQTSDAPGANFGTQALEQYRSTCKTWPRGEVPAAFYTLPPAPSPVMVLSGGADPVTPPRHGERVAQALSAGHPERVQHVVVPEAGHGVMAVGCMRDVMFRFIDAKTDDKALPQDVACATRIPRPVAFQPVTIEQKVAQP